MVKALVLAFFILTFAVSPVWLFDHHVLPQLAGLQDVYGNADANVMEVTGR